MNAVVTALGSYQMGIGEMTLRDYFALFLLISGIALIVVAICLILHAPDSETCGHVAHRPHK